jgi:hypothetical protein
MFDKNCLFFILFSLNVETQSINVEMSAISVEKVTLNIIKPKYLKIFP